MKSRNILVACQALDYILIYKILKHEYVIDKAESREDIINLRKSKEYDLLLIDIKFLRPDFEVIAGVKETKVPVIVITSEPYDNRDKELKKAGCCACYVKPIRQDMFVDFVTYWLHEHRS